MNTTHFQQKPEYRQAIEEAWPLLEQVKAIADKYGVSNLMISASTYYPTTSCVRASDYTLGDGYGAFYEKDVYYNSIAYEEYEYGKVD